MKKDSGHKKEDISTSSKRTDNPLEPNNIDDAWNVDQEKPGTDYGMSSHSKKYDHRFNNVTGFSSSHWEDQEKSSKAKIFIWGLIIVLCILGVTYFIFDMTSEPEIVWRDEYNAPNDSIYDKNIAEENKKSEPQSPKDREEMKRRLRVEEIAREERDLQYKVERFVEENNYKNATVFYPKNLLQSINGRIDEMEKEREIPFASYEKRELKRDIFEDMFVVISEDGVDMKINFINELRKVNGKGVYSEQEQKDKTESIAQNMINSAIFRNEALSRFSPTDLELSRSLKEYRQVFKDKDAFITWVNERYESENNFTLLLKSRIVQEKYNAYLENRDISLSDELSRLKLGLVISRPKDKRNNRGLEF